MPPRKALQGAPAKSYRFKTDFWGSLLRLKQKKARVELGCMPDDRSVRPERTSLADGGEVRFLEDLFFVPAGLACITCNLYHTTKSKNEKVKVNWNSFAFRASPFKRV